MSQGRDDSRQVNIPTSVVPSGLEIHVPNGQSAGGVNNPSSFPAVSKSSQVVVKIGSSLRFANPS